MSKRSETLRKKRAEEIYKIVNAEMSAFIDEYEVKVRKPLPWEELPKSAKAYWLNKADQLSKPDKEAGMENDIETRIEEAKEQERERLFKYLQQLLKINPKASLEATIDLIETTKPTDYPQSPSRKK